MTPRLTPSSRNPFRSPARSTALLAALALLSLHLTARAALLASFTLEHSQPTSFGPFPAESGLHAATSFASISHADALATHSIPTGNGSHNAWSSNFWRLNDAYLFHTSSSGFESLTISFDQTRSSTGPRNFRLDFTLDGTLWTPITTYVVSALPWSPTTWLPASSFGPFPLPTLADNQPSLTLRLLNTTTGSAPSGTNTIDNIHLSATPIQPIPEPTTPLTLLAAASLTTLSRRRN